MGLLIMVGIILWAVAATSAIGPAQPDHALRAVIVGALVGFLPMGWIRLRLTVQRYRSAMNRPDPYSTRWWVLVILVVGGTLGSYVDPLIAKPLQLGLLSFIGTLIWSVPLAYSSFERRIAAAHLEIT